MKMSSGCQHGGAHSYENCKVTQQVTAERSEESPRHSASFDLPMRFFAALRMTAYPAITRIQDPAILLPTLHNTHYLLFPCPDS